MFSNLVIKHVLFDVADTLLHKPALLGTIRRTLANAGITVDAATIARAHRATRELLTVPDRTGREFYLVFNFRFLEVLGVLPTPALAEQIYLNCRSLPWEAFPDTAVFEKIGLPVGVVSNWDSSLREKLATHFKIEFAPLVISEEVGFAKPDQRIYKEAIRQTRLEASEILFIGDSIRLDIVPAVQAGMTAVLVDRYDLYPSYNGVRVKDFNELPDSLKCLARGA